MQLLRHRGVRIALRRFNDLVGAPDVTADGGAAAKTLHDSGHDPWTSVVRFGVVSTELTIPKTLR